MTVLEVLVLLTVLVPTVTVGAAVIWWARHRGRPAAGAGAAAPAAVVWHQRPLYWAIGLTVAVIILAFIWGKAGTGVMTVIMVGAGAIYLIMKAGTTGKVLGVPLLLLVVFFGPNFTKFTEKFYEKTDALLEGKPMWDTSKTNARSMNADGTGKLVFTVNKDEWTPPVRVNGGRCYTASTENPGLPEFRAARKSLGSTEWTEFEGYSKVPLAWVRFSSQGPGPTTVIVEIRRSGQCS